MTIARDELRRLGDRLVTAMPPLTDDQQRVAIALYRLLAEGNPVSRERLASRAGVGTNESRSLLSDPRGVYFDDQGRVVGFWGMALDGTPHRMRVDGREIHAWCAWDTLFLPELIDRTAAVESSCATTGETVTLTVGPGGVRDVRPDGAVLSFMRPSKPFDAGTITSFCHFVYFFASREAAEEWTASQEGTFTLSIDDGFELGKRVNRARFGAVLGGRDG